MGANQIKKYIVMILLITLVVIIQVECLTPSQEFKLNKFKVPLCEIMCNVECSKGQIDDFKACVEDCKKTKC